MGFFLLIFVEAALHLCGASCEEDIGQETVERFEAFEKHPLNLNSSDVRRLRQSGLLTDYQLCSLQDYISRNGEIMSWTELGAVDGFGMKTAEALSHFCILSLSDSPGQRQKDTLHLDGQARGQYKDSFGWCAKLSADWSGRARASVALKEGKLTSACASWQSGRWSIVAGSFNARFGQGLWQWSGFRIESVSTVDAFALNPTGISPCLSYSSAHLRGVAADLDLGGRWTLSAYATPDRDFGAAATLRTRRGTYSLGASAAVPFSVSARSTFGSFTLFGEVVPGSAVAGAFFNYAYDKRLGLRLLATPKKCGTALGLHLPWLESIQSATLNTKTGAQQHKSLIVLKPEFGLGQWSIRPQLRWVERYQPQDKAPWRSELRCGLGAAYGVWKLSFRADAVKCLDFAWLWQLEAGFAGESFKASAFGGLYCIDSWQDRIYVYEADVSGTYNAPAIYGRGWRSGLLVKCYGFELKVSAGTKGWYARLQYVLRL